MPPAPDTAFTLSSMQPYTYVGASTLQLYMNTNNKGIKEFHGTLYCSLFKRSVVQ